MICPKCNSEMAVIEFENVKVNKCTGCAGLWFNDLEHEVLKNVEGSEIIDSGDAKDGARNDKIDDYSCPNCSGTMVKLVDKEQPQIWYEVCHSCYGVYFDAGEFSEYKHFKYNKYNIFKIIGRFLTTERK